MTHNSEYISNALPKLNVLLKEINDREGLIVNGHGSCESKD